MMCVFSVVSPASMPASRSAQRNCFHDIVGLLRAISMPLSICLASTWDDGRHQTRACAWASRSRQAEWVGPGPAFPARARRRRMPSEAAAFGALRATTFRGLYGRSPAPRATAASVPSRGSASSAPGIAATPSRALVWQSSAATATTARDRGRDSDLARFPAAGAARGHLSATMLSPFTGSCCSKARREMSSLCSTMYRL